MDIVWDCVIVGGGAAGLSAGLVLGRARRRTLLVDAGEQSNSAAHGIGGLLGQDGRPPAELYAAGRVELAAYSSVELRVGEVTSASRVDDLFVLEFSDGRREQARRVLLATGMEYRPPRLPGLAKLWGRSVFHCPFCHGWEVRDRPLAALARGERGVHAALLLRAWTDDVVLLTDGPADLDADDRGRLVAAGVTIDERPVAELVDRDGELAAIVFADGGRLERGGLLVATTLHQRSRLADQLGAAPGSGMVAVDPVAVDPLCRTTAPGVFAAGDVSVQFPQVAAAIASGSLAATAVVQSLLADDFGLPFPPRAQTAVPDTSGDAREFWEQHYGGRVRVWSGRVNPRLAEAAESLPPGRALDLGCGEGADALWLAERGWDVVAADISATALQRAVTDADARGLSGQIDFQRHDLSDSFPSGTFDLVSAQFLHSPVRLERDHVLQRAADAVAPGGQLLIVDHGSAPPWAWNLGHDHQLPAADEVLASLQLDSKWQRATVESVEREAIGPDHQVATVTDNVIVLRRVG